MDLATTKAYALPGNLSAGITHGSWSSHLPKPDKMPSENILSSNKVTLREDLEYSASDLKAVEEWVKRHVESTWHSLGTCSMAPKEGNNIVKHGVLDERLNIHGVEGLKVADLSICPDNVSCNT
jgi:alcohol oxidase